jgi:hypothetical protein
VQATTTARVLRGSRPPVASAGGPYFGVVGVPIEFNGSGSSDPDGDPLTYSWGFGDGSSGVGVRPHHAYASANLYSVFVLVSDGLNYVYSFTTARILSVLFANVTLQGKPTVALMGGGTASTCVRIEPLSPFDVADIDPQSVVMTSNGTGTVSQIHAVSGKGGEIEDSDKDGVPELVICFRREDMRQLLSSITGRDTVSVSIEARLMNNTMIQGTLALVVVGTGGPLSAALAPNPLNPRALLSFVMPREGSARVEIFDVSGRRVRTLLEEQSLPAGYHELVIDGRNAGGEPLASGVYFYRIDAAGEVAGGRFAILK